MYIITWFSFSLSVYLKSYLSNAEACRTDLVCTCRDCAAFSDITDPKLGNRSNVHDRPICHPLPNQLWAMFRLLKPACQYGEDDCNVRHLE
jgi:hypothetical protein